MRIKSAEFVISAVDISKAPQTKVEIAIAGRSNAGKSSFINFICDNKKLAKTSKEPGRTRLLNYFECNKGEFFLVDLPGYGYAKVSFDEKRRWARLLEDYFEKSKGLRHVFLVVDIRHNPTKDDIDLINYLYHYHIPFTIIATKADKLSRAAQQRQRRDIAAFLKIGTDNIILVSSIKKTGKEAVLKKIFEIIQSA